MKEHENVLEKVVDDVVEKKECEHRCHRRMHCIKFVVHTVLQAMTLGVAIATLCRVEKARHTMKRFHHHHKL